MRLGRRRNASATSSMRGAVMVAVLMLLSVMFVVCVLLPGGSHAHNAALLPVKDGTEAVPIRGNSITKAWAEALRGGVPGAMAMGMQVLLLMWLRTTVLYQYRYGTSTSEAMAHLYKEGGGGAGGLARFYRGLVPALVMATSARFVDTAANSGVLSLLEHVSAPVVLKTLAASAVAGGARMVLYPLDTVKAALQVEGPRGMALVRARLAGGGPCGLYHGAGAAVAAAVAAHYPWFAIYNYLSAAMPEYPGSMGRTLLRSSAIGFVASLASDAAANGFRVLKTYKQTAAAPVTYLAAAQAIVAADGLSGLFLRGLGTKLVANAAQSVVFSILWRLIQDAMDAPRVAAPVGGASEELDELPRSLPVEPLPIPLPRHAKPKRQKIDAAGARTRAAATAVARFRGRASPAAAAVLPPPSPRVGGGGSTGEVLGDELGTLPLLGGAAGHMPRVGFGTAGLGDHTAAAVSAALTAGYRLLDSAQSRAWYREDDVGRALAASGLPRSSVFLTSKLHPRDHGTARATAAFRRSLSDLRTPYLDLFLLHYPTCWPGLADCEPPEGGGDATPPAGGITAVPPAASEPVADWRASWRALESLVTHGAVRAIGVSNFDESQLRELLDMATVPPAVVQAHSDPLAQNRGLQALCRERGVVFQAYSSLGAQWRARPGGEGGGTNPVLDAPPISAAAASHGVTPGQVVLAWALARGQAVIPRSARKEHIVANRRLAGLSLTAAELAAIDDLDGTVPP